MSMNDYIFKDLLGEGAYGQVWEVWNKSTGKTFAVKTVYLGEMAKDSIEKIIKECEILKKINHPNVLRCYESGIIKISDPDYEEEEAEEYYAVVDFLQGRDLKEILDSRNNPFPYVKALEIIRGIAEALVEVHKKNVIHRDVKAENVVISDLTGKPILLDFGIAYDLDSPPKYEDIGEVLGTPYYMAPEYIQDSQELNKKVDVYALGNLLYYLIDGNLPFRSRYYATLMEKHIRQAVPTIPEIPEIVNYLIEDMMAKNPHSRPSAKQVVERINNILKQERRKSIW